MGRVIDAGYHLLDRQIVDFNFRFGGKVDDVELTFPEDGGPPFISGLHSGTGAYASRVARRLGPWMESIARRLSQSEHPNLIWFGIVQRVESAIEVSVSVEDLPAHTLEKWWEDNVVAHIPGSGHATE